MTFLNVLFLKGVAHNIIERIDVAGKDVLVIGAGPVGLFCVANAKALGLVFLTEARIHFKLVHGVSLQLICLKTN